MKKQFYSRVGWFCAGLIVASSVVADPCEKEVNYWPYSVDFSGQNARVVFEASLALNRDCRNLSAQGFAGAGAELFGLEALLLESNTDIGLRDRRFFELYAGIAVLGFVVDSYQFENILQLNWQNAVQFPIDVSGKEVIMVGPIPVTVNYGIEAEVGVRYDASMAFLEADLAVDPFVDSAVYARAGVDVGFAKVKASGRVQLLDDQLQTKLRLTVDQVNLDRVYMVASGDNAMQAMNGVIEVFAGAKLGTFEGVYSEDLFRWDGYSRSDRIYDIQESIALR